MIICFICCKYPGIKPGRRDWQRPEYVLNFFFWFEQVGFVYGILSLIVGISNFFYQ